MDNNKEGQEQQEIERLEQEITEGYLEGKPFWENQFNAFQFAISESCEKGGENDFKILSNDIINIWTDIFDDFITKKQFALAKLFKEEIGHFFEKLSVFMLQKAVFYKVKYNEHSLEWIYDMEYILKRNLYNSATTEFYKHYKSPIYNNPNFIDSEYENQRGLTKYPNHKFIWKGTPAQLAFILNLLQEKGYLDGFTQFGERNANITLAHFDVVDYKPTPESLGRSFQQLKKDEKIINPEDASRFLKIPHRNELKK